MSHHKETEEMESKMEIVCEIKETLIEWMKSEMDKGKECVDTEEAGAVIDMIKDLAKAEKDCWEACYYKSIVKAMEEADEEEETMMKMMMGFTPSRQKSRTNRFKQYDDIPYMEEDYMHDYLEDPEEFKSMMRMGYVRGSKSGSGRSRSSHPSRGRGSEAARTADGRYASGYTPNYDYEGSMERDDSSRNSRHGQAYNDYQNARRHYTETKSMSDKAEMHTHANEHIADTMATIRDIWKDADPDLKKSMKSNFQSLLNEMAI